jgi:hypothetical protein
MRSFRLYRRSLPARTLRLETDNWLARIGDMVTADLCIRLSRKIDLRQRFAELQAAAK